MKSLKNVTPEKVAAVLKLMRKGEQLTRQAERRRRTALVVWFSALLSLGLMVFLLDPPRRDKEASSPTECSNTNCQANF